MEGFWICRGWSLLWGRRQNTTPDVFDSSACALNIPMAAPALKEWPGATWPTRGISSSTLKTFHNEYKRLMKDRDPEAAEKLMGRRISTREICELVVKPLTAKLQAGRGGAFVEISAAKAAKAAAELGEEPTQDVATIYVCHAWDAPFEELVAAVDAHDTMAQASTDPPAPALVVTFGRPPCRVRQGTTRGRLFTGSISSVSISMQAPSETSPPTRQ